MSLSEKIYKSPLTYILLFSVSVMLLSYFDPYGGITLDAPWYLRLAQSIKEGEGFTVMAPDYIYYNEPQSFFIWPPVYPVLTGVISFVTQLPVYISIKLVNLLFISITFFVFKKYDTSYTPVYILLMFHAAFFDMAYEGWSEVPFICTLLWFLMALKSYSEQPHLIGKFVRVALLAMLAVGLRYLGIITLLPMFFMLYKLYKQKQIQNVSIHFGLFILTAVIMFAFLWLNYFTKNKLSGYSWNPSLAELKDFAVSFFLQLLNSLDVVFSSTFNSVIEKIFILSLLITVVYQIIKHKIYIRSGKAIDRWIFHGSVLLAVLYILVPVLMRNSYAIGLTHIRFFTVSMMLFLFGVLQVYKLKLTYRFVFFTALGIFCVNGIGKVLYINQYLKAETFADRYERMQEKYHTLEPQSAVAFADKWIEFLRLDIYAVSPYENVMKSLSPALPQFKNQILKHPGPVYFEIIQVGDHRMFRYNSDIADFHKQHQGEEFVKLK